jgi:RNA recognition motif-containing protein
MDAMDRELELLLNSVDRIEASEEKRFIDKSAAEKVASAHENDQSAQRFHTTPSVSQRPTTSVIRMSGDKVWVDPSLSEWPENDYRIHVRNLPADASDRDLVEAFQHYKSFAKAKVIFDSSGRNKRYGFVSLLDMNDYIDAMKNMANAFIKSRRVTLTPSKWREKSLPVATKS